MWQLELDDETGFTMVVPSSDDNLESRWPLPIVLETRIMRATEKTSATTETSFYRQQICRIVENTSNDVCAIATARLEHAISMKKMEAEIPRALRLKLNRSMQALRQRERDPWCNELIQPASAAIYWLGAKRRIRKKSRVEDLLLM